MAERYNKAQLVEDLSLHVDIQSKAAATRVVEFILDTITDRVSAGDEVAIGSFGKFYPYTLSTGKTVPKFRASDVFKAKFNS